MVPSYARTRRVNAILQLVFAFLLFISLNLLGNVWLSGVRLDLTENNLYTLSPAARDILARIDQPITLKFYFSRKAVVSNPPLLRYGQRVRDFLEAVDQGGGENIRLEIVDPERFSPEEDEAAIYGLQPLQGEGGDPIYMGLVATDEADRLEVIPRFSEQRDRFLEYDVMKAVYLLSREGKPKLGILSGLPMRFGLGGALAFLQGQGQPYIIYRQLAQFFELVNLQADFADIPVNLDALLVVHPPQLTDAQLYRIDQAVLGGLPVLVFVDPYAEVSALTDPRAGFSEADQVAPSSDLAPLLKAWGLGYSRENVVADLAQAQKVEMAGGPFPEVAEFVHWFAVGADYLNQNDPISAELGLVNFASAGALTPTGDERLHFTPLVQTSPQSALVETSAVAGIPDPSSLARTVSPEGQYTLVAKVAGTASSAFAGAPGQSEGEHIAEGEITVLAGGDADLFEDQFWARMRRDSFGREVLVPFADNAALIVNAIDHLSGSGELASLQARGVSTRPLEKFEAMSRAASAKTRAEEERLQARLEEAEARLSSLLQEEDQGLASPAAEDEIQAIREEVLQIRRNLREVERALRADVAALERTVIVLNSGLIPLILLLAAMGRFFYRMRKVRP